MLTDGSYDAICLQETHFLENDKYPFHLPRYTLYSAFAPQGDRRGGVSIYVSHKLPHNLLPIQTNLQAVACTIRVHQRRITLCSLYLPPTDLLEQDELIQLIRQLPKPFLICTDANSKHMMWGSPCCDQRGMIWMGVINQLELHVLNDGQPTRLDESTGVMSHIDLTLASSDIASLFEWNPDRDLHSSDHFPLHIHFRPMTLIPDLPSIFSGWNTKKADWMAFQTTCNIRFNEALGVTNCDSMTEEIINTAKQFIPTKNANSKYQCPWWSSDCREAIRNRRRAQNRMRRDPFSQFLRLEYRRIKAQTRRVIKQAKQTSWRDLLSTFNHRTPMKRLWEIIRKFSSKYRVTKPFPVLLQHNVMIDDPHEVVGIFGKHFEKLCSRTNYPQSFIERERDLVGRMPDFGTDNRDHYNRTFMLAELQDAIGCSGSTSVGPDKVHYDFIRHLNDVQLQELLQLFNHLWSNDIFPDPWKHSYLIPIVKPGKDCTLVESYRPIQLTSCLCKLMERMVSKRLSWCIEKYDLLSKYQCAFRTGKSTVDQLVRLDSHIREGFLHHSSTLAVFLDIKSAYNMVSPTMLLHRMHHVGFRGHMMHFIRGFLSGRTFQVRCGVLSDIFQQESGIVQGGVISPILFNLAIDSVTDALPRGISCAIYADDVTIWTQGRHIPTLFREMQRALVSLGDWAARTGFVFSSAKSNAILFRRSLKRLDLTLLPDLQLNGERIAVVNQVKYLGVILDSKLNLHSHVEYIKGRAQQRMSVLKCVAGKSYGADRTVLLRMYKAIIRPILEYASFLLDGPGNRRVDSLETIQNACLRIATGALRTSPVRALQVDTNIPPLQLRRKELLVRYFLKVLGDRQHPCHSLMDISNGDQLYSDVSDKYLHRVSGFPVTYRVRNILNDLNLPHPEVSTPIRSIAPWTMHSVRTHMLLTQDKRQMTMIDIQTEFQDLLGNHAGYRVLFTDGSKLHGSASCAFTVNNAFYSFRLQEGLSIYTAELVAIREAMKYVRTNGWRKALICTDSLSAVKALKTSYTDHPVLQDILDINHDLVCAEYECTLVWIPGHSGIAGNVRADYWARKAHEKPNVTNVSVGYREYVPAVQQCIRDSFAKMWQDCRHTHLQRIKPNVGVWASSARAVRKEEVVLCRLRLGHTLLTHSYILDRAAAPMCDTCQCQQDVQHLIMECRLYRVARRLLFSTCRNNGLRPTLENLLGNDDCTLDSLFLYLRQCDLLDRL